VFYAHLTLPMTEDVKEPEGPARKSGRSLKGGGEWFLIPFSLRISRVSFYFLIQNIVKKNPDPFCS
jgi:hypothetical protein